MNTMKCNNHYCPAVTIPCPLRNGPSPRQLRLALKRKCRERGYPFTRRMLEVANFISPAFYK